MMISIQLYVHLEWSGPPRAPNVRPVSCQDVHRRALSRLRPTSLARAPAAGHRRPCLLLLAVSAERRAAAERGQLGPTPARPAEVRGEVYFRINIKIFVSQQPLLEEGALACDSILLLTIRDRFACWAFNDALKEI
ncbi:hypothetical protein EVAR_65400_1 [Eumeta japonica]|uniref:Uncharacterized protein n=1 Tax=Eumeta variegata TaxID=151549 RepID=A0A4C1ZSY6_EUMVA|nr:hypothetical protein EVAR_65400_1 [Eumeta japonica]